MLNIILFRIFYFWSASRNGKLKIHKNVIFSLLYGVKTDTPH